MTPKVWVGQLWQAENGPSGARNCAGEIFVVLRPYEWFHKETSRNLKKWWVVSGPSGFGVIGEHELLDDSLYHSLNDEITE